jgi:hypothetical protein
MVWRARAIAGSEGAGVTGVALSRKSGGVWPIEVPIDAQTNTASENPQRRTVWGKLIRYSP